MTEFGPYKIIRKIGSGSMGTVYLAYDPHLDREFALKVLKNSFSSDMDDLTRMRFHKEAKILARLNHPNIVRIYSMSFEGENPSINMEFINGESLNSYLKNQANQDFKQKVKLTLQLVQGILAIHNAGLVHRDLKPENILITRDSVIKIMDFGISKDTNFNLTLNNEILGSPAYMSPEQIKAEQIDNRSDIFSLGILLCLIFGNKNPFQSATMSATFNNIIHKEISFSELDQFVSNKEIQKIIKKCLCPNPKDRYASVSEIVPQLEAILEGNTITNRTRRINTFDYKSWSTLVVSLLFLFYCLSKIVFTNDKGNNHIQKQDSSSELLDAETSKSYAKNLGFCGDHICSIFEKTCHDSCPSDCSQDDLKDSNDKNCKKLISKTLQEHAAEFPYLKCGDGICTFIESKCGICTNDCPQSDGELRLPACLNLYKSVNYSTEKNGNNDNETMISRTIYDHCYFKLNNNTLETNSFIGKMMKCLSDNKMPTLNKCRKSGPPSAMFNCLILEN